MVDALENMEQKSSTSCRAYLSFPLRCPKARTARKPRACETYRPKQLPPTSVAGTKRWRNRVAVRKREGTAASAVTRHKRGAECGGIGGSGGEIAGETPRRPCPSVCGFRKCESPESASLAKWNELSGNIHIPSISLGHAREFSMRRNCSGPHAPLYFICWNGPRFRIGAKAIRLIGNMQAIEFLPESAKFEPEST